MGRLIMSPLVCWMDGRRPTLKTVHAAQGQVQGFAHLSILKNTTKTMDMPSGPSGPRCFFLGQNGIGWGRRNLPMTNGIAMPDCKGVDRLGHLDHSRNPTGYKDRHYRHRLVALGQPGPQPLR